MSNVDDGTSKWPRTVNQPSNMPLLGQHAQEDVTRFRTSTRLYLETSAFNYFVDNWSLANLELTRAYQRRRGIIFVTSPTLLWEIMLNSDRKRADRMLLAAQALFDPVLLGTPTELTTRYMRSAYPDNIVNYDICAGSPWAELWPAMTRDFTRTLEYSFSDLLHKTAALRLVSKNLSTILDGREHSNEIVRLSGVYVTTIYEAIREDLASWGVEERLAKFVILYGFLLLLVRGDIDGTPAANFWAESGFVDKCANAEVTRLFVDYPELFRRGPLLSMAIMAMGQHVAGGANRGALLDGMHMVYTPFVDAIISNDEAFLHLACAIPYFRGKVRNICELDLRSIELNLENFADELKLQPD